MIRGILFLVAVAIVLYAIVKNAAKVEAAAKAEEVKVEADIKKL